ncbi:hypothetical protein PAXINDRAFT_92502 [Paxillus involutus ATCC 200175]|uniref:WD40 repeat-like protein n=1 Tax=Paxillus involutus ATCC 200175 TaxID=664439 RepID=A0A0C9SUI8_PAXIN|nr:hypothetical protein PAXINDRAFT_92502 [Paxillus involutus ATCC 200175]
MHTSSHLVPPTSVRVPSAVWSASSRSVSSKNAGLGTCVSFYPDGNKLVSGSIYGTLNIQDQKTGAVEVFNGHTDIVQEVDVSRNGRMVVSGSNDKTVRIWDGASGERIHVFEGHEHWVLSVGFSPDSSRVVSGSRDRTIWVHYNLELDQWRTAMELEGAQRLDSHTTLSPNGTHLVTSNWHSTTASVYDVLTGERVAAFEHNGNVNGIAYSPSGKFIATACDDRTVYLWEAPIIEDLQNQVSSILVTFTHR